MPLTLLQMSFRHPVLHRLPLIPRATALLAFSLLVLSCDQAGITSPTVLPAGAVPFTAPAVYEQWWADMETCSGRFADMSRVNWFVVPDTRWFEIGGVAYDGYWLENHHRIVLPSARVQDSLVVRHEMLHDLLDDGHHPREFFLERCGSALGVSRP